MIVVLQELSMYKTLRFDEYVPQNLYFDAGAAADHMCLMAHALGLGSCWLTHGEETQKDPEASTGALQPEPDDDQQKPHNHRLARRGDHQVRAPRR